MIKHATNGSNITDFKGEYEQYQAMPVLFTCVYLILGFLSTPDIVQFYRYNTKSRHSFQFEKTPLALSDRPAANMAYTAHAGQNEFGTTRTQMIQYSKQLVYIGIKSVPCSDASYVLRLHFLLYVLFICKRIHAPELAHMGHFFIISVRFDGVAIKHVALCAKGYICLNLNESQIRTR